MLLPEVNVSRRLHSTGAQFLFHGNVIFPVDNIQYCGRHICGPLHKEWRGNNNLISEELFAVERKAVAVKQTSYSVVTAGTQFEPSSHQCSRCIPSFLFSRYQVFRSSLSGWFSPDKTQWSNTLFFNNKRTSFNYTNKIQRYAIFFITVKALRASGGLSAHHQEFKNHIQRLVYVKLAYCYH